MHLGTSLSQGRGREKKVEERKKKVEGRNKGGMIRVRK